jgi:hypothetical protein
MLCLVSRTLSSCRQAQLIMCGHFVSKSTLGRTEAAVTSRTSFYLLSIYFISVFFCDINRTADVMAIPCTDRSVAADRAVIAFRFRAPPLLCDVHILILGPLLR